MNGTLRKIMRAAAIGLFAAVPFVMAPCESALQYPTPETVPVLGVPIDSTGY